MSHLIHGRCSVVELDPCGQNMEQRGVLRLSLAVSHSCICRVSELFADGSGKTHNEFGLARGGVAFLQRPTPDLWRCANRVDKSCSGLRRLNMNGQGQRFRASRSR